MSIDPPDPITHDAPSDIPAEPRLVQPGSRWVHRGTGSSVEIASVENDIVSFRQEEQVFRMLLDDFVKFHRPFTIEGIPTDPLPDIDIAVDEEWEGPEGLVRIVTIDSKREIVTVTWSGERKRTAPLSLREFGTGKWRKIQRRTVFQRLLDDDEDD